MSPRANPGERLRRLLAVIPWLAARGTASLEEIAERFGVDVATVEDELLLAACCGLPPYSPDQLIELVVDDDGVTANVPDYFRRPLKLTAADGFAILAAGRALLAVPGSDPTGPLATALDKLAGVLGGPRGVTVELDAPARLHDLRDAVAASERVAVEYYSASRDEVTSREIDPLSVFADRGRWYVAAYCHRAQDVLTFRVDRVRSLRRTGETFDAVRVGEARRSGAGGGLHIASLGPDLQHVTLLLPAEARWVAEAYPTTSVEDLGGGRLRVRLAVTGLPWLERLLLRVGPEVRVEEPAELVAVGRDVARRLLDRYLADGAIGAAAAGVGAGDGGGGADGAGRGGSSGESGVSGPGQADAASTKGSTR
ncbi:MAG: proteasome accessory factor [Acidimicrobiaceae bacterium]|nr:proteasome accessory factor [Acidimicrobiaceae bacterium]